MLSRGKCVDCQRLYTWPHGKTRRVRDAHCLCGERLYRTTHAVQGYTHMTVPPIFTTAMEGDGA